MPIRDAAEAIGYSRNSMASLTKLCRDYGVTVPPRTNQHSHPSDTVPAVSEAYTAPQRHIILPANRKMVGVERCIVLGDIHAPFHDPRALALALAIVEDVQPETIVLNGDIIDLYAVSRFNKDPSRALMLQDEIDQTREILQLIRDAAPSAHIVYVEGNHEARMRAYLISQAQSLSGLRSLTLESQLGLDELGIEYVPSRGRSAYWRYGAVTIGHFDKCSKHSAYTEKALVDDRRESIVQGHTHRGGTYYKTLPSGEILSGVGSFCLCDTNPEYVTDPDWAQGLVVLTKRTESNRFHTEAVPFIDHEALWNDTLYSG